MKKNIAIIATRLNDGGAERIAGLLSKELSKYYNVYLFLLSTENIIYEYGGTIVDIGQSGPFYEYSIKIYKELYKIEVAISFLEMMNFANIRGRGKERIVISERCVQSLIDPPFVSQIEKIKRYYNYADEIVSCSEGVKFDLIHNFNVKSAITTIYNFIDKESIFLKSKENLPGEVQSFLGGEEFFVNVGRLHPQKNQRRLILQFSYFHARNRTIKLLILGSGELESELVSFITELGLSDSVKIMPYTRNPFMYMARAKAIIHASHYEGLPNVLLEAMALGTPVVATDCLAGPRELLMDESDYGRVLDKLEICKRGILVCDAVTEDDGTTSYMAQAMELVSSSVYLVQTFRQNMKAYMEQYTNKTLVEKWLQIIENCTRNGNADILSMKENKLNSPKHIVIYGAGFVGRSIFLRLSGQCKIDCFVVSTREAGQEELFGIPVYSITELNYLPGDTMVIIGVGDDYQDDVINMLHTMGYEQIVFPYIEPLSYDYYTNCKKIDLKEELKGWYRLYTGMDIDIDNPQTFNEKIQWLKLYDNTPIKSELADKVAVRDYVKKKISEKYLIPLLGVWDSFDDISFEKLPSKFVLKCNHGSGMGVLVYDKFSLDYEELRRKFILWMEVKYEYMSGFEMHYANIVPKILAEKMLETEDGSDLKDYKVFVFNGKAKLVQVDIDRHHVHKRNLYTPDWEYLPYGILYPTAPEVVVERPECLRELISLAEQLGEEFIHVRVDFYVLKNKIYFGEMTFTHGSGVELFTPQEFGFEAGAWMDCIVK